MEQHIIIKNTDKTKIVTYCQPEGSIPSPDYTLKVNGENVFVYHMPGFAGGSIAYAQFDFTGEVIIEIQARWIMDKAQVHPISYGIKSQFYDNTIKFTINEPKNLFIKWNDSFELPFYLFTNPIDEVTMIDRNEICNSPSYIYFGPGIHEADIIEPNSGQTVFIDGGAIVKGTIFAKDKTNISVKGRGLLVGSHIAFGSEQNKRTEMAGFKHCQEVSVEGIIILDSFGWTLVFYDCDNVNVNRIRIMNERKWSTDGINPCNSRNVLIENCFIRSKDDCISIKGLQVDNRCKVDWTPIYNNQIRNCVFWSDNNNSIVVGAETRADMIEDIVFENCDILKSSNTCGDIAGAISIVFLDDTKINRITFQDIRIEYTNGPIFNFFYTYDMFCGQIPGSKKAEGGTLQNIMVKNISYQEGPFRNSYIRGLDNLHLIENVTFENIQFGNKRITCLEEGRIYPNEFTKNIKIV